MSRQIRFGDWCFDPDRHVLANAHERKELEPRVARLLEFLLAHPDEMLSHDRLVAGVWDGRVVTDDAVRRGISALRQALAADDSEGFIKTIHKKGYVANFPQPPLEPIDTSSSLPAAEELAAPEFVQALDAPARIAQWHRIAAPLALAGLALLAIIGVIGFNHDPPPQVSRTPATSTIPTLAVLPFMDMSESRDQEYFSEGISEELLTQLAKVPALRVIARTSSFAFKGKDVGIADIARTLRVTHVLEGSVRKAGSTVRVTAQLIRTTDGTHLWAETYDRPLGDIFAVQDEITGAVVDQLKIKLLGAVPKARVVDPAAYTLFLHARQVSFQGTAASIEQALALYQQVLTIDPNYPDAWSGQAGMYLIQVFRGMRPAEEGLLLSRDAASKALALDPGYAPAYSHLGYLSIVQDHDLATAARQIGYALALEPANLDVISDAGVLAWNLGQFDRAIAIGEYIVSRDPLDLFSQRAREQFYLGAGRWDEAIASAHTVLSIAPEAMAQYSNITLALLAKGDAEGALAAAQQEPDEAYRLVSLAAAYHALGRPAESDAALAEVSSKYEKRMILQIALVYAGRNDSDRAFGWLDKALSSNQLGLADVGVSMAFAKLRDDPRWLAFLRKIGAAPEQLAAIKFEVTLPE